MAQPEPHTGMHCYTCNMAHMWNAFGMCMYIEGWEDSVCPVMIQIVRMSIQLARAARLYLWRLLRTARKSSASAVKQQRQLACMWHLKIDLDMQLPIWQGALQTP